MCVCVCVCHKHREYYKFIISSLPVSKYTYSGLLGGSGTSSTGRRIHIDTPTLRHLATACMFTKTGKHDFTRNSDTMCAMVLEFKRSMVQLQKTI